MIYQLTQENFQTAIQSSTPMLIDFWAEWCGPCRMQGDILHQLAEENQNLRIGKVNSDECRELVIKYGISAIPTLILFQNGQPLERVTGLQSAAKIKNMFLKHGVS